MVQAIKQSLADRHSEMKLATYELQPDVSILSYDYLQIDTRHRKQVIDAALEIRRRQRRIAEDSIAIGERLIAVKAVLPHGQFLAWVEAEFGYRPQGVSEEINMAERAAKFPNFGNLNLSSARLLAAPSVPDEAVEDALEAAEKKGAPLTVAETKHFIERHKAPPKMITVQATVTTPHPTAPGRAPAPPMGASPPAQAPDMTLDQAIAFVWGQIKLNISSNEDGPRLAWLTQQSRQFWLKESGANWGVLEAALARVQANLEGSIDHAKRTLQKQQAGPAGSPAQPTTPEQADVQLPVQSAPLWLLQREVRMWLSKHVEATSNADTVLDVIRGGKAGYRFDQLTGFLKEREVVYRKSDLLEAIINVAEQRRIEARIKDSPTTLAQDKQPSDEEAAAIAEVAAEREAEEQARLVAGDGAVPDPIPEPKRESKPKKPKVLSAHRPDDPLLHKARFILHETDQGWRYYWQHATHGDLYGPLCDSKEAAAQSALMALAGVQGPKAETEPPAMPADLAAAGYRLVKVSPTLWAWQMASGPQAIGEDGGGRVEGNWVYDPADAIEEALGDYISNAPAPVAPMTLTGEPFDAWLQACPTDLTLRECVAILELAKATAKRSLDIHQLVQPSSHAQSLYNAVYGALPTWSHLIREMDKAAKHE